MKKVILLGLTLFLAIATDLRGQDRIDPVVWIEEAKAALASTDNYTTIFHKQERVRGVLGKEETIFLKFKKPFKVYMKWIKEPHKGRELLYVEGWNKNRIKANEGGIPGIFNLNLNPKGKLAMKGNRHPITATGLENIIKVIGRDLRRGTSDRTIKLIDLGEEMVYGRMTAKFEGIFPDDEERGYYCFRSVINLDVQNKIPLKIKIYDKEDNLIENYGYEDIKLNAGLSDADFDPKNPKYGF
jgi:hypothetical protein